jgi:hypothetical protein
MKGAKDRTAIPSIARGQVPKRRPPRGRARNPKMVIDPDG